MTIARQRHTASVLANGKVLVTGGIGGENSAELYDPATGTWRVINNMKDERFDHTASVLANGRVLITGGYSSSALNSAELYDSSTESWIITENMNHMRNDHTASILINGKILVAGGYDDHIAINSTELYQSS
ncbi:unnamed protein product [Adineta steineri]|uniref:Uncharacterized protein n=1 Tax=Adineta steineri TaxID=433720 RepID=A0A816F0U0_9BILA|nr:unnamed protein product [Adineta steineri]CAF1652895.1 unnamed protein product [Adineta steineri]